jgi:arylsulfatase A-like enzyme
LGQANEDPLTGRNHHAAAMRGITEIATSAPGYNSLMPNTISPLAQTLKLIGGWSLCAERWQGLV